MKVIGNKKEFSIEYELFPSEGEDEILWDQLHGILAVYVKNKNICRYSYNGEECDFEGVLFYIVEWLCENLSNILGYDPYPLPVEGNNLLELIDSANTFDTDDEIEEHLWFSSEWKWKYRHSWSAVATSAIPNAFFRRSGDMIEISWDNDPSGEEGDPVFMFMTGTESVELELFRTTVLDFLIDLFGNVKFNNGEDGFIVQEWIGWLRTLITNPTTDEAAQKILEECEKVLEE